MVLGIMVSVSSLMLSTNSMKLSVTVYASCSTDAFLLDKACRVSIANENTLIRCSRVKLICVLLSLKYARMNPTMVFLAN